jgi:hypothetical protein
MTMTMIRVAAAIQFNQRVIRITIFSKRDISHPSLKVFYSHSYSQSIPLSIGTLNPERADPFPQA